MTELLSIEHAWSRLTTHLEWADRFWVLFIFTDDPRASETLCRRAREQLDGADTSFAVLRASKPDEIDELTRELIGGSVATVSWVDVVRHDDVSGVMPWAEAWERLMLRLNERRELLRRRSPTGGIVFATTLARLDETPALAPDLWTIRALLLRVATPPAHGRRDPRLARQAVARARGRSQGDEWGLLATLLDLAEVETDDASLEAAREAYDWVQEVDEPTRDEERSKLVVALRRLGDLFRLGGYDAEAEACYRRGLARWERIQGTRWHPEIAASLAGLGRVLDHMAEYSPLRAAELRKEALEAREEATKLGGANTDND